MSNPTMTNHKWVHSRDGTFFHKGNRFPYKILEEATGKIKERKVWNPNGGFLGSAISSSATVSFKAMGQAWGQKRV